MVRACNGRALEYNLALYIAGQHSDGRAQAADQWSSGWLRGSRPVGRRECLRKAWAASREGRSAAFGRLDVAHDAAARGPAPGAVPNGKSNPGAQYRAGVPRTPGGA